MADDPKLAEFRERNIQLMKQLEETQKKFEGIDPDAVKADRIKLAALEIAKPSERITELETALAAERTARADMQKRTDALLIETTVSDAFLKAGGLPKARGFIAAQAAPQFLVENGSIKGTKFSPSRPGEAMTVDEWIVLQTREHGFCFYPSAGGGSTGSKGGGGTSGVKELRDPTPQELGRYANDIAAGKVRVVYSS
jgi:hypothetical protein